MIVLDASAVVELLLGTQPYGEWIRRRLRRSRDDLHAPHLMDAEVAEALRKLALRRELEAGRAVEAVRRLGDLPILRHAHGPYLQRAFEARDNLSIYDSLYLMLAAALDARLLTRDRGLAAVAGARAELFS